MLLQSKTTPNTKGSINVLPFLIEGRVELNIQIVIGLSFLGFCIVAMIITEIFYIPDEEDEDIDYKKQRHV